MLLIVGIDAICYYIYTFYIVDAYQRIPCAYGVFVYVVVVIVVVVGGGGGDGGGGGGCGGIVGVVVFGPFNLELIFG